MHSQHIRNYFWNDLQFNYFYKVNELFIHDKIYYCNIGVGYHQFD